MEEIKKVLSDLISSDLERLIQEIALFFQIKKNIICSIEEPRVFDNSLIDVNYKGAIKNFLIYIFYSNKELVH